MMDMREAQRSYEANLSIIREIAEEHGIPIIENPPIARALPAGVEVDQKIAPEHFKAVAEIIGYVFRLKEKMPKRT